MTDDSWRIFQGRGAAHDGLDRLPPPPPWRGFEAEPADTTPTPPLTAEQEARALAYLADGPLLDAVNAALYLRRPLLVTGKPGTGKSSLAAALAAELKLGAPLVWPISARSAMVDAIYQYDAIGRLQEATLRQTDAAQVPSDEVMSYLRLGPLGTALLAADRPRVLLIDEFDKSDIHLPNELLHLFETGTYTIRELERMPGTGEGIRIRTADPGGEATVVDGRLACRAFPIVIITSNAEREFSDAFLRRCIQVTIQPPAHAKLVDIVTAQLGSQLSDEVSDLLATFVQRRERDDLATDQLLNAIYLVTNRGHSPEERRRIADIVMRGIGAAR